MNQCSALCLGATFGSRILIHNCIKRVRTHPVVQHGPHPKCSSLVRPVWAIIPPPSYSPFLEVIPRRSLCQGHHRQSTTSEAQGLPLSLGVSQCGRSLQANKLQQRSWTLIPLQASPACPALKNPASWPRSTHEVKLTPPVLPWMYWHQLEINAYSYNSALLLGKTNFQDHIKYQPLHQGCSKPHQGTVSKCPGLNEGCEFASEINQVHHRNLKKL